LKNHYKDNKEFMQRIETPEFKNYIINVLTTRKTIDKLRDWNIEKTGIFLCPGPDSKRRKPHEDEQGANNIFI
jgi:hypothetical protein